MPTQDTSEIKEKILSTLKRRGPSLPVHIARETGLSILFASAFLSELISEKKIRISNMRVGNSPIYLIQGQEFLLENFSQYLKSKEKDAFLLLKEKKILKDTGQDPAIRVALRVIKDFAIPFKKDEEIFWRYFTIPETELEIKTLVRKREPVSKKEELGIFDKQKIKTTKKKATKKTSKVNEKFFNKVRDYLNKKGIEILDIESFSKNDLTLRIRDKEKEKLLVAYNKKRVIGSDLIKAYKKASELGLLYIILSLGEPAKKLSNFINTIRNLESVEKI